MKIKLKQLGTLTTTKNHYGLKLDEWYKLQAGEAIDVKKIPSELSGLVDKVKGVK